MKKPTRCTTHSYACDCREYKFYLIKNQNEILKKALEFYSLPENSDYFNCDMIEDSECMHGEIARQALKECEDME